LLTTGFFRQVRELKIQRKNPGSALRGEKMWYIPPQKILLAENRFLQAGKGAENTKEKSRQCFKW
jgi:hypothetical protein